MNGFFIRFFSRVKHMASFHAAVWRRCKRATFEAADAKGATLADGFDGDDGRGAPGDALARRLASLALGFSNATAPLTTAGIKAEYYPGLSPETFARQFRRDRERLVLCGLAVHEADGGWVADKASFAEPPDIAAEELAALDIACLQLVSDPSFPYRDDLRIALAKIDDGYEGFPQAAAPSTGAQARQVPALLHAFGERRAVAVAYTDAAGTASRRTLAIWGVFGLRGHTYFVAPEVDAAGIPTGEPHTWRDDRFCRVDEVAGTSYRIPEDFDVEDFRKLPFQIGPDTFEATFRVPPTASEEGLAATGSYGETGTDARGRMIWTVAAADLTAAAHWAVAVGLVPVDPGDLVDAWRGILSEVIGNAGK